MYRPIGCSLQLLLVLVKLSTLPFLSSQPFEQSLEDVHQGRLEAVNQTMDKIQFNYSTKNIPCSGKIEYMKKLIQETGKFFHRATWKAHFALDPEAKSSNIRTFGFRTQNAPPHVKELDEFKNAVIEMIRGVQFRSVTNEFQEKLKADTKKIKNTKEIIVKADKTRNFYKVPVSTYDKLLQESITKEYKKAENGEMDQVNLETAKIARTLQIADRMEVYHMTDGYITLKDHKDTWPTKISTRLINTAKTDLGKVAHVILKDINRVVREKTEINQWVSTKDVIQWFNSLENTQNARFLKFDIESFYPSITKNTLIKALEWAEKYVNISGEDKEIILQARKTFLFKDGTPWVKKNVEENFDIAMGAWDGAECCEIVGLYLTNQLIEKNVFRKNEVGIYRDDGMSIIRGPGRAAERTKQKIIEIFAENDLKITSEISATATDYLDVYLNLEDGLHRPYKKPNDVPIYVHKMSNHPPTITKKIPQMIAHRLSVLSSNEDIFKQSSPEYLEALKRSGYKEEDLKEFHYIHDTSTKKRRKRVRNILWYNPPWDINVKTDIGRKFLQLVSKHFPKGHPLHKTFNRSNVKFSYCNMKNIKSHIDKHNRALLAPKKPENKKTCNCRKKSECPMNGECLTEAIVYQADVEFKDNNNNSANTNTKVKTYFGNTGRPFKKRFYEHQEGIRHKNSKKQTALSNFCWKLKEKGSQYEIKWSIKTKAHPYTAGAKACDLCLSEKLAILQGEKKTMLNSRNEIMSKCRHKFKYCLANVK